MAETGWHLGSVGLFGSYRFNAGDPAQVVYRLDYQPTTRSKELSEYQTVFEDAGWEYVGEMANWQYWRKPSTAGETPEIFTDNESKIKKYQRLLLYMAFMLVLLIFLGRNMFVGDLTYADVSSIIAGIYFIGRLLYAIIIPIYIVVVVKLFLRINQLKRKAI